MVNLSDVVLSINGIGYDELARTSVLNITNTTGIAEMEEGKLKMEDTSDVVYDLSGRRIQSSILNRQSQKGIYIVNGKKVVVK